MIGLLLKIIPLDLASTLSPGILALVIFLLGSKRNPKAKTFALFLGIFIIGIIITIVGFTLGKAATIHPHATELTSIIDLVLGIIFMILALNLIITKDKKRDIKEEKGPHLAKWFFVGVIITITNLDALFLNFAAGKEVGQSNINDLIKIIFLIINLLFFTLPVTLPGFFYLIVPNAASKILTNLNGLILKYSRFILAVLFIIFGIYLIINGAKFFI